ncbi:dynein intermediate chain 2, ciliary-like [Acyrthosiphon pisum]|uniref:Dynein intermediate chain 1, axonemal n=2 Tax=Acyrthosiphon pisum TaxID=7029 RepID=A0A8R1W254_ACYPI|nr:dynein intermediate chain 2, ciliary-like [Acyrthosiphon pisum]|eukprot:XP_001950034.2 PREDICTED: dynein intermediate chain 2, ciliary-like [Acyrthosiphon pisum]
MKTSKKKAKETAKVVLSDDPVKPDDQLILSQEELDEVYGNGLFVKEPPTPHAKVIYSNKQKTFLPKKEINNCIKLFELKSTLFHRESMNAIIQIENELCRKPENLGTDEIMGENITEEGEEEEYIDPLALDLNIDDVESVEDVNEEFMHENMEVGEEGEVESISTDLKNEPEEEIESRVLKKVSDESFLSLPVTKLCTVVKLKNKFNFFDRVSQTKKILMRNKDTQTPVTKKFDFAAFVSPSDIYGTYEVDYAIQKEEKEKEMREKLAAHMGKRKNKPRKKMYIEHDEMKYELLNAAKILEKNISLNATDAIAQDFRYYEDPSDQFRDRGEGTLMLMWTMVYEEEKKLIVTDITWSPDYFDMFAITLSIPLGELKFTESPDIGYVCLWVLKNSSYPDYVAHTQSGAMCLSFHHDFGYLLAVGLRDGNLAVYNVSLLKNEPQYSTHSAGTKIMASVMQVVWCKNLPTGEMNFFSVSEDGLVCQWILMQNELMKVVRMSLVIDMYPEIELGGIKQTYYARGTTIAFNPTEPEIYLIGTVEGYIFKCNTEWSCYVQRFKAHEMPINRIDFNKFDSNIYLTCSEDFVIKLWEDKSEVPLIIFDLQTGLTDVRWSPFSSSVFCVITVDCRVLFYDLDVSTKNCVCEQLIHPTEKYRLVRLAFDRRVPMIVVGSSRGTIVTYKLSPNLRAIMKSPKKGVQIPTETLELEKLHTVLNSVRE